jgi:hypothetical protein
MKVGSLALAATALYALPGAYGIRPAFATDFCIERTATEFNRRPSEPFSSRMEWPGSLLRSASVVAVKTEAGVIKLNQREKEWPPFKVRSILCELHTGPTRRSMKR